MTFALHPQLEKDTLPVGDLPLCTVLLMNDSSYPWLILVPKRQGIKDLTDLPPQDLDLLWPELTRVHDVLKDLTGADKMNIGALGNMVPQLHVHVIARFKGDKAWPKPVWGQYPAVAYTEDAAEALLERLRGALLEQFFNDLTGAGGSPT